jgi:hypothetical protein
MKPHYGFALGMAALLALGSQAARVLAQQRSAPDRVTELLDALIQPRFQKDGGVFGMRRVVRSPGHEEVGALTDLSAWDKKQLAQIRALKHDYRVAMLRVKHPPGHYRKGQGPIFGAGNTLLVAAPARGKGVLTPAFYPMIGPESDDPNNSAIRKTAMAALPELERNGTASGNAGPWKVTLRPVRATKGSCVGCHQGSRLGDTLGVLVYAVDTRDQPAPAREPAPRRARGGK